MNEKKEVYSFRRQKRLDTLETAREGSLKGSEVAQETNSGKIGGTHVDKFWDSVSSGPILLKITDEAILSLNPNSSPPRGESCRISS